MYPLNRNMSNPTLVSGFLAFMREFHLQSMNYWTPFSAYQLHLGELTVKSKKVMDGMFEFISAAGNCSNLLSKRSVFAHCYAFDTDQLYGNQTQSFSNRNNLAQNARLTSLFALSTLPSWTSTTPPSDGLWERLHL